MKRLNLLLIAAGMAVLCQTVNAQMSWVDFGTNSESGKNPEWEMTSDSTFSVDFFGVYTFQKQNNDTLYDVLKLPGKNGITVDLGFPELPVKTMFIELLVDTPQITVEAKDYILIDSFNIWPAQEVKELDADTIESLFTRNDSIYQLNQFYPNKDVTISTPTICRGHKVSTLVFYPVQFNPCTKQLKVLRSIDITVHGAGLFSQARTMHHLILF